MGELILRGKVVIRGEAQGEALVSREPLSFWGGYDWKTGEIIDRRHILSGEVAAGKIFAVPFTRGSSTTTAVLLEAIRAKIASRSASTGDRARPSVGASGVDGTGSICGTYGRRVIVNGWRLCSRMPLSVSRATTVILACSSAASICLACIRLHHPF